MPEGANLKRLSSFFALYLVAFLFVTILFSIQARAAEVPLAADAHVNVARPTINFGTVSNLYIGNGNTALLQFDLTTLPVGLTSPQVARAILTIYVNRVNAAGTVTLAPILGSWTEGGVTYSTAPTLGPSMGSFVVATAGSYVTIDVTTLVQGWLTVPSSNFGVALSALTANVLLDSKENDETGHAAQLDINVTSTGAQGIQGMQGLQGVAGPIGGAGSIGLTGAAGLQGLTGGCRGHRSPGSSRAHWAYRCKWIDWAYWCCRFAGSDGCRRNHWSSRSHWYDWRNRLDRTGWYPGSSRSYRAYRCNWIDWTHWCCWNDWSARSSGPHRAHRRHWIDLGLPGLQVRRV